MTRPRAYVAFSFLFLVMPVSGQTHADADRVRARRAQSNQAIARHDVSGILSFFDDDFQVTAGSGALLVGHDEMRAAFQAQFDAFGDVLYVRTAESVEVGAGATAAAEVGTWVGTWTTSDGPLRTGGRYSAHWRKAERGWVIRSELFVTLFCEGPGCPEPE